MFLSYIVHFTVYSLVCVFIITFIEIYHVIFLTLQPCLLVFQIILSLFFYLILTCPFQHVRFLICLIEYKSLPYSTKRTNSHWLCDRFEPRSILIYLLQYSLLRRLPNRLYLDNVNGLEETLNTWGSLIRRSIIHQWLGLINENYSESKKMECNLHLYKRGISF